MNQMPSVFRRQVLKLRLMKLTIDIQKVNCVYLTKQFNVQNHKPHPTLPYTSLTMRFYHVQ